MPTEQQKKKTAQTLLQTAQNPGTPANMARILGVAGEGIADFASKAYEYMVPQSVEEWALEGSPVGKAIGLIPPKYIRPLVERLKGRVQQNFPSATARYAVEQQINQNPRVAAHLTDIRPEQLNGADAQYANIWRPTNHTDEEYKRLLADPSTFEAQSFDKTLAGPTQWWGGSIEVDPRVTRDPEALADALRHEFNHTAQDISGELPQLQNWTDDIHYSTRPEEIGSRISERRGRLLRQNAQTGERTPFNYSMALEDELAKLESMYAMNPERYPDMNVAMMYMNEKLKPKGLKINATLPSTSSQLPASMAPKRRFSLEKIVLDK